MFTLHRFRCVLFMLFVSTPAMSLLVPTVSLAQTKPVTVSITQVEQIGDDLDFTSLGDFYAKVTIDGTTQDTRDKRFSFDDTGFIVPSGPLIPNPAWVLTKDVPSTSSSVSVRIEILDDDGVLTGSDDQLDINPASGKGVIDIVVDLTTGKWSGDVNWPQNCVSAPFDLDSNNGAICFEISVLSASGDADGDGLLDGWEQNGFNDDDVDHPDSTIEVDLPALGANPLRKDIFVQVDCLVASDHSHCPRQDAITDVIKSFANAPVSNLDSTTGVQLHLDIGLLFGGGTIPVSGTGGVSGTYGDFRTVSVGGGGTPIAEAGREIIDAFGAGKGSATKFADLKSQFFNSQRASIFRYAIFGHQTNARRATNDCTSGIADSIPGHDFLVTLGGSAPNSVPCWTTDLKGFSVGSRTEQGGTFMHELGHTLGLFHGGDQPLVNDKPNYLSVMNYSFQQCFVTRSPNGFLPGGCDYSRIALPPLDPASLDETKLDECIGIDAGRLGFGSMDWNGNRLLEGDTCIPRLADVSADINNDGVCILPGQNGRVDSTLAGDDVFVGDDVTKQGEIHDGPNRLCNTAASGDDVALQIVGQVPPAPTPSNPLNPQPNPLTGFDDWGNLQYSLLASAGSGGNGGTPVEDEADPDTIRQSREFMGTMLAPGIVVTKTGLATARPGDVVNYTIQISNQGPGPALEAVLTDTRPDGGTQVEELGAVVVGSQTTRTSSFTVPANACPGDDNRAAAALAFKDFVGTQLTASGSAPLQILDVAAPTLTVSLSPSVLWPPDHKFQDVTATITIQDNCDPHPTVTLVSITSSEPATGVLGNGDQGPDIQGGNIGTDDRTFSLRSERDTGHGNTGRVYTITYRATDRSGNSSDVKAIVTVPASNSGH